MRQQTLAVAFHTLQLHGQSWDEACLSLSTCILHILGNEKREKEGLTAKEPSARNCCVVFSRARVDAFGHIRSRFLLLSFYFQNLLKRESNQATIEDSFHIKRPVATPLPLRLLPQMVFQDHVAFPESQAAGISPVRTKQRCVP